MHPDDVIRELEKVARALEQAVKHHTLQNEANAALHLSDRVMYTPLTSALVNAEESVKKIQMWVEESAS